MANLTIVHLSDTHLKKFPELESGNVLVHSGDALNYGSFEDLIKFREQLKAVKDNYKIIIYVAGNHDWEFEKRPYQSKQFLLEEIPNLVYLHHEAYEFEGVKFFGSPLQPAFCNWAFNVKDNLELYEKYLEIPEDTEVLITHCPPEGTLDQLYTGGRVGSRALKLALPRLTKLKAHLFGHIHAARGIEYTNDIWYSNAAICDENYKPTNKANIIELDSKAGHESSNRNPPDETI